MDEGDSSASQVGRFTPAERIPLAHLIGECLGLRASLDTFDEKYVSFPAENWIPDSPANNLVPTVTMVPCKGVSTRRF